MNMWNTLWNTRAARVGVLIVLALAAIGALVVVLQSSGNLRGTTFNEAFPPPPPELSVPQKMQVVQSVSSSNSSSTPPVSDEEKNTTLQEIRATSA
ncbi:MAG: hypothetical protein Q8P19_02315, partial [bacterium]|nr:hypothetical protein [bacterium]